MAFSLFPSDWQAPHPKDMDKNGQFLPKEVNPKHNIPKAKRPIAHNVPLNDSNVMPAEEMCIGEQPIDISEIDEMLAKIGMMAESDKQGSEVSTDQAMVMIANVNAHLKKNIETLKAANPYDGDTVTREDLIKLLEMFKNYSETLESYFKAKAH
jgi:hypothetical protein